jgi:hypothetical protein
MCLGLAILEVAVGCSSGGTNEADAGRGTEAGVSEAGAADGAMPPSDAGSGLEAAACASDAGTSTAPQVNGCTDYIDYTDPSMAGMTPTVQPWMEPLTPTKNGCLKVKAGTSVTWSPKPSPGHPLVPHPADPNSPIKSDNAETVSFPCAGTFGFWCNNHMTEMQGVIWVVP